MSNRYNTRIDAQGQTLHYQVSNNTFQCISLQKTLRILFSNSNFRNLYFSENSSCHGFIRNHRDGSNFRDCSLFRKKPIALRLQTYFDEVEVLNPLGSKTKIQEVAIYYFRILNLPVTLGSLSATILTFAVVKNSDLANDSFDFVHWPLIQEIKILETEGMSLDLPDSPSF